MNTLVIIALIVAGVIVLGIVVYAFVAVKAIKTMSKAHKNIVNEFKDFDKF